MDSRSAEQIHNRLMALYDERSELEMDISLADDMRHDSTELENALHELNQSIAELEKQMREAEAEHLPKMFAGMEGTL